MKILVLGGGAQGLVIACDLARSMPGTRISVADVRDPALPPLPNLVRLEADLSDFDTCVRLLKAHDLGVCALPARLGARALRAGIEAGRSMVDVSFSSESPLVLDAAARAAGVTLIPDCGLAPGLSHLLVGHASRGAVPDEVGIYVGGVAEEPSVPYGYVVTWSVEDLLAEYTRPARVVLDGRPASVAVFSGLERLHVDGVGEMEAFCSDGLRTLLETLPGPVEMVEKALRWPGHAAAVQPLVESGRFVEELRRHCEVKPPLDVVALVVRVRHGSTWRQATLVDRYDVTSGMTAMARTTAYTTSVGTQLLASGAVGETGVRPLELVGRDEKAYRFFVDRLARRGVGWTWREHASLGVTA